MTAVTMPRCSRRHRMDPVLRSALSLDVLIIHIAITLKSFLPIALSQVTHVKCDVVAKFYAMKVRK